MVADSTTCRRNCFTGHRLQHGERRMTAKEAADKSGLSIDRVYQFCRNNEIDPANISDDDYQVLMIRRQKRKVKE
jgi:hypothetical protein